jgi:hypothetical protein
MRMVIRLVPVRERVRGKMGAVFVLGKKTSEREGEREKTIKNY